MLSVTHIIPDISRTVRGTRHVKCYTYHARTGVTVSDEGRNATQCMIRNHIFNI